MAAVVELTGHVLDLVPLPIERNVVEKRHLAFRFSRDTGSDVASGENIGDQMADTEGFALKGQVTINTAFLLSAHRQIPP